jgi:hypothetical protein
MIGLIHLNLSKLNLGKMALGARRTTRQPRSAVLGLALDGRRLEAVLLRRSNGSVRIQQSTVATLELNLLTDDPELVGREIRNHLERAQIRERQCTVCLPLEWAFTLHTPLPELPPEDVDSFLQIEAERGLPFALESLSLFTSRCVANGAQYASVIAVPKEHLATLQRVLKAAQLKPISFSLGLPALEDPSRSSNEGVAALSVGDNSVELQVACGGGIGALRTLQGALEQDGVRKKPYVDVVARDLRITLGQLPTPLAETVRRVRIYGSNEDLGPFAEALATRTKAMGLNTEWVKSYNPEDLGVGIPPGTAVSPALTLAARLLSGRAPEMEFLPPKVSTWQQLTHRYSSAKLRWTAAAVGAVLLLIVGAFAVQQWQLGRWKAKWTAIKPRVTELENMQQKIRQYRPWFDESFRCLSILQKVTEAFPEDASVVAKTVEVRDPGIVTCSGTARDQQALLKVVDQLRATKEISSVQVDQIRGKLFTINLRWVEGGTAP